MNNRTLLCVYHRVNVFKSTPSQSSRFDNDVLTKRFTTRIHSSRMRTVHCSGHLSCHARPLATHAPCDACRQPHMPPPKTHAPCHAYPPAIHTPYHAHPLPHMPSLPHITFTQLLLRTVINHTELFAMTESSVLNTLVHNFEFLFTVADPVFVK